MPFLPQRLQVWDHSVYSPWKILPLPSVQSAQTRALSRNIYDDGNVPYLCSTTW